MDFIYFRKWVDYCDIRMIRCVWIGESFILLEFKKSNTFVTRKNKYNKHFNIILFVFFFFSIHFLVHIFCQRVHFGYWWHHEIGFGCIDASTGDLIDILALINSGINFILYCSMSRQFRKTFIVLFQPKFLNRWLSLGQDDEHHGAGHTYIGRDEQNGLTTQVTQV